jgi:peptidoglycan hydrolase CwlO-like protein
MAILDLLPYLLVPPAVLVGVLAGWYLAAQRLNRSSFVSKPNHLSSRLAHFTTGIDDKRKEIQRAEADLARLETQHSELVKSIDAASQQVDASTEQYNQLLAQLSEVRASGEQAETAIQHAPPPQIVLAQPSTSRNDDILEALDQDVKDLELLQNLHETYLLEINRLTQQAEEQGSQLQRLRQMVDQKESEINDARQLLELRDAELRRLIHQRQQREINLVNARRVLKEREDELRHTLHRIQHPNAPFDIEGQVISQTRVDVPRRGKPLLASGDLTDEPEYDDREGEDIEDNLTIIPGLAELYAEQLKANGITTFAKLAAATPQQIERSIDIPGHFSPDIAGWIRTARALTTR